MDILKLIFANGDRKVNLEEENAKDLRRKSSKKKIGDVIRTPKFIINIVQTFSNMAKLSKEDLEEKTNKQEFDSLIEEIKNSQYETGNKELLEKISKCREIFDRTAATFDEFISEAETDEEKQELEQQKQQVLGELTAKIEEAIDHIKETVKPIFTGNVEAIKNGEFTQSGAEFFGKVQECRGIADAGLTTIDENVNFLNALEERFEKNIEEIKSGSLKGNELSEKITECKIIIGRIMADYDKEISKGGDNAEEIKKEKAERFKELRNKLGNAVAPGQYEEGKEAQEDITPDALAEMFSHDSYDLEDLEGAYVVPAPIQTLGGSEKSASDEAQEEIIVPGFGDIDLEEPQQEEQAPEEAQEPEIKDVDLENEQKIEEEITEPEEVQEPEIKDDDLEDEQKDEEKITEPEEVQEPEIKDDDLEDEQKDEEEITEPEEVQEQEETSPEIKEIKVEGEEKMTSSTSKSLSDLTQFDDYTEYLMRYCDDKKISYEDISRATLNGEIEEYKRRLGLEDLLLGTEFKTECARQIEEKSTDQVKEERDGYKKQLEITTSELTEAKSDNARLLTQNQSLAKEVERTRSEKKALQEENSDLITDNTVLESAKEEMERSLAAASTREQELRAKLLEEQKQRGEAEERIAEAEKRAAAAEERARAAEERAAAAERKTQEQADEFALSAKEFAAASAARWAEETHGKHEVHEETPEKKEEPEQKPKKTSGKHFGPKHMKDAPESDAPKKAPKHEAPKIDFVPEEVSIEPAESTAGPVMAFDDSSSVDIDLPAPEPVLPASEPDFSMPEEFAEVQDAPTSQKTR